MTASMGVIGPATPVPLDLADLNEAQRRAALHPPDGPLLIVAGAGTGKTRTLAARLAQLLERGLAPERLLLLTFTRQAARELLSRARSAGGPAADRVWGGTFHSVAHRLLRIHGGAMGLGADFGLLDRGDAEDLLDLARADLGLAADEGQGRFPAKATCLALYSRCVNAEEPLEAAVRARFPWLAGQEAGLRALFRAYEERKDSARLLDLDDLLGWWRGLVEDPSLGPEVAARFDHVLVDEYQDTNRLQRAILLGLRRASPAITVVGDDAQAIYGFRAATVRNILDFEADFPGAAIVRLETNHRSSDAILAAANAVTDEAREGHRKRLRSGLAGPRPALARVEDERAQAELVIQEALARLEAGTPLRRQAVLFRAAHHPAVLEVELGRRRIPFRKYGGLRFLDAAHVKDALAVLRVAERTTDAPAWFRLLRLLEGVGPRTARRLLDAVQAGDLAAVVVPAAAREAWAALVAALGDLRRSDAPLAPGDQVRRVKAVLAPVIARLYERPAARLADLEALAALADARGSRRELLADLALEPPTSTGDLAGAPDLEEDWLVLSTIHSAKGLEWDAVTLIHAVDGCLPSDLATGTPDEVEEERRLLYVALTRARRWLTVIAPWRLHVRERQPSDRSVGAPLSRFLAADAVRACFDERGAAPPVAPPPPRPSVAADLRARALRRWG